jgi:uncharacterized protein (DUF302 family)
MFRKNFLWTAIFMLSFLLAANIGFGKNGGDEKEYGVYEYVIQSAQGSFEDISAALETGAAENGWQILAKVDAGVPKDCTFRARVFVLYDSVYADKIMAANRTTGPFAVVDRINLFEDENGLHVSVVNPSCINRTVLMEDKAFEDMSEAHLQALRKMITSTVQGSESKKQYGQIRSEGYISRTMGVVAGGKFIDKLEDEAKVKDGDWQEVAAKVGQGLSQSSRKWGMHKVFELALPQYETVIFGSTGTPMDSKSFNIVGAGTDESRENLKCPGLAHAAAYPMEIVVTKEENQVKVRLVEVMFRMKMYFEDAGKWAFMKNVRMPGSIQDELAKQIKAGLK